MEVGDDGGDVGQLGWLTVGSVCERISVALGGAGGLVTASVYCASRGRRIVYSPGSAGSAFPGL